MSFIKTIKTGQGVLGWDDDLYRSVLKRLTGKTSAKTLTAFEAEKVIKYMRTQGFKKSNKFGVKPKAPLGGKQILAKIEAILAENKLPWAYAQSMSEHMYKLEVEKLDDYQLHCLLKALIIYQKRQESKNEKTRKRQGAVT